MLFVVRSASHMEVTAHFYRWAKEDGDITLDTVSL